MNTMSDQGCSSRVKYDGRDDILVGRVLGLRSNISLHGETVAELRRAFPAAVQDYLADCNEQGLSPEKPASGKLPLRVSPEVHSRALLRAQTSGKSLTQRATEALERAVHTHG